MHSTRLLLHKHAHIFDDGILRPCMKIRSPVRPPRGHANNIIETTRRRISPKDIPAAFKEGTIREYGRAN